MKIASIVGVVLALSAAACTDIEVIPKGAVVGDGGSCPHPIDGDMAAPLKKPLCKAAEGLIGGDDPSMAVTCIDFANADIPSLKQPGGWIFEDKPGCRWAIENGRLVNTELTSLSGGCQFQMPQKLLNSSHNQVTLSIKQAGSVSNNHNLRLSLFMQDLSLDPLLSTTAISNDLFTAKVSRSDTIRLPGGQIAPIIHMFRLGTPSLPGWQIESIAIITRP